MNFPETLSSPRSAPFGRIGHAAAGFMSAVVVTAVITPLEPALGSRPLLLIYLGVVVVAGALLPRAAVFALAITSGLAWNFFFTAPRFSLRMDSPEDITLVGLYLAITLVMGGLAHRSGQREAALIAAERRAATLCLLTRDIADSPEAGEAIRKALSRLETSFSAVASLLVFNEKDAPPLVFGAPPTPETLAAAECALSERPPARAAAEPTQFGNQLLLPLPSGIIRAALHLRFPGEFPDAEDRSRILADFAQRLALVLEHERIRERARESAVARESEKLHRALLDNVSHELKTPVAVILAASDNLRHARDPGASERISQEIDTAARRLAEVVGGILELSRFEAGLAPANLELCEADDLIVETLSARAGLAESGRVRFRKSDAPAYFKADSRLAAVALGNLLENALRYAPPESPVEIFSETSDSRVRIGVRDRGPGVPEAECARLFSAFRRGASAAPGGLGLGLHIAKTFVEVCGGVIRHEPTPEGGSVFLLDFPAHAAPVPR